MATLDTSPVVLLSGASRGIGAATARQLAGMGASITLLARSISALAAVAARITEAGTRALPLAGDVSDPEFCQSAVRQTRDRFGAIDALINNAGMVEPLGSIESVSEGAWRRNLAVNFLAPFYLSKYCLDDLRRSTGRIVNVSSGAANRPLAGAGAYCSSKAALTHFTRVLAAEEPSVTAVSMRPGVVDTAMQAVLRKEGPTALPADQAAFYHRLKADGLLEKPSVPARAIAWLALHAPREWSGEFLNYDDPRMVKAITAGND